MTVNEVVEPVGRVVECLGLAVIAVSVAVALAVYSRSLVNRADRVAAYAAVRRDVGQGVLLGLIQTAFPLAVLPLSSALRSISRSYDEAASTLGATRLQILRDVILPLAAPGFVAGAMLVFAYNMSAFAVPLLLGGRRVPMLALLVHDQVAP